MSARKSTGKNRVPRVYEGRTNYATIGEMRAAPDPNQHADEMTAEERRRAQNPRQASLPAANEFGRKLWVEGNGQ